MNDDIHYVNIEGLNTASHDAVHSRYLKKNVFLSTRKSKEIYFFTV